MEEGARGEPLRGVSRYFGSGEQLTVPYISEASI